MIVLSQLRNNCSLSGYDIIAHIHDRFGLLMSSGTIYSLLYRLEREGLAKGKLNQRKRVYTLTDKGEEYVTLFYQASEKIPIFIMEIFNSKSHV
jgi:DNA-binding PadR family transcriptional regulator